ncbi:MAG: hypothetical protein WA191_14435 [Telluria sp.]
MTQRVYVGRGLTHKLAWKRAKAKATRDFRGMVYDAVTGWAKLV